MFHHLYYLRLSLLIPYQSLIGNDTGNIAQTSNLIWDIPNNNLGIGKNPSQKLDVNGTIAATLFSGSGASLTGFTEVQIPDLDSSKIKTGTINNARLPANYGSQIGIGTTPTTQLDIYNATSATIRLQTVTTATPSIELIRGTATDASSDWIMSNNPTSGSYIISSST